MSIDRRVLALILALVGLNLLTIAWFPIVWGDEVMFAEPAWNLASTGYMNSRAWFYQDAHEWWAGNAPLHSLLLAVWLKLVGLGLLQVRAFGLLEFALSVACLLWACTALGARPGAQRQALFVLLAFMCYGLAFNYRSGRYDPTGILLLCIVCLAWARGAGGWGRAGVAGLVAAFLIPAAGVHAAVFLGVLLLVLAVLGEKAWWPGLAGIGLASVLGALVWLGLYAGFDLLEPFLHTARFLKGIQVGAYPKDPSLFLLIAATLVLVAELHGQGLLRARSGRHLLLAAVLLVLVVPPVFWVLGRFPTYYSWMLLLPLALLLTQHPAAFATRPHGPGRWLARVRWGLVVAAALVGLPLQLVSGFTLKEVRDYRQVETLARQVPDRPGAPMLASPAAWYALLPRSGPVYLEAFDLDHRFLSPQQLQQIEYALLTPEDHALWMPHLGGAWEKLEEIPPSGAAAAGGLFRRGFGDKLAEYYELGLYRRLGIGQADSGAQR